MLLLTSTSDAISVISSASVATDVQASWVDLASGAGTPGRINTAISTATTTTVVAAPASSTQRNVKHLSIRNKDATSSQTVTVRHTDGTTTVELFKCTLLAGETLLFNDGTGFTVYDSAGGIKQAGRTGRYLRTTVLTSGTSYTTGPDVNTIFVRMIGGGGQGGGCAATIGCVGSGGGSGGYAEKTFAVSPNTAYTYAIGAGGTTGGTGANGQAGADTTFAVGATTVTAKGGSGGIQGTSISVPVLGGAGGTISTNGDVNTSGTPGEGCITTGTAANNRSGSGASSLAGGGANAVLEATNTTGTAAGGFGSGGSGAATSAATARAGGAGSNGVIMVDEYA
jgi:hypothetical protein